MKCTIPEISWHNREPVLSVHIQPFSEKFYRLATGGADCHVLIWQLIINENGSVKTEALSDLTRHQKAVNSVRWSPSGQHLATADDDANIIVWQLKTDNIPLLEGETNDKETWIVYKVMRGHKEDIYDLCWSPNGLKLFSGSIDNTAVLWDFTKGKNDNILTDHKGFVQGVAWDPKGHYLATISTDRICRIYESSGKQVKCRIQRGCLPVPEDHYLHNKEVKFFHDDTFKSFFRRLDFSPDGTLLAVPSGRIQIEDCKKILNATLLFAVESWAQPIAVLPSGHQCSTVVRFCPILFELHKEGPDPMVTLPFRMIVAVGTDHDVILYDTQQAQPFAYFKDIHYTRLTDLTWSDDGLLLVASSTDGFCALITFEPNELGVQYVKEESEVEESVLDVSGCEELEKEDVEFAKPKKLNLLEQWTVKTPKKKNDNEGEIVDDTSKRKREVDGSKGGVVCKRIKPTLVEDKKGEKSKNEEAVLPERRDKKEVVRKRIKPVLIEDKKISDVVLNKEGTSTNISPLLNFLKRVPKEMSDCKKTPTMIDLTLDEPEARDAWKCGTDDVKEQKTTFVIDEEYTEEFSLHLEDTNSPENKSGEHKSYTVESTNCETEKRKNDDTPSMELSIHEGGINLEIKENLSENNVNETESQTNNTENCVQRKDDSISNQDSKETVLEPEKVRVQLTNLEDKVTIPKKRVPLITLSSPKHKKK